ncbi:MAG: efflux RND transporter periplasmic adaptor subunit [Treponema sp.]|jgi:multidrug efflux pump subunit AcrA (membrane-fusion protein)|nr:efflux RND transporter periplasmic adaptor subunit [Treponema sp.]
MKKMKIKGSTIATALIIAAIIALAGYGVHTRIEQNQPVQAMGRGMGPQTSVAVRVMEVARDSIENSVLLNGDVLAVNQVMLFPTVSGRVTETLFSVGDSVNQGAVVAMVDPSRPGQVYSVSPVVSTIGGTVLQVPVQRGDTVSPQTPVYVIGDLSSLKIETFVPERFSNAARHGLYAQVRLEALPGETFMAVVEELSPVLDPASRTLRIRLRFTGAQDQRIRAGMFATVMLVTNSRHDVPIVPRGSLMTTYDSWLVFTVDEDNIARRQEVTLGLENENFIEITSGLEVGDKIVVAGQNFLSHGDLVRIVN